MHLPKKPWADFSVDFLSPIQPTNEYVMVMVDYYSCFNDYSIMSSTTASQTSEVLANIFFRYGIRTTLKSDNGPQFTSAVFKDYLTLLGIDHY